MRHALHLHPDSTAPEGLSVEVAAIRSEHGTLVLRYAVTGSASEYLIPVKTDAGCAEGLWRHSCFEAFVRVPPGLRYEEFNFSPSSQWASYAFNDYRSGMTVTNNGPTRMMTREAPDQLTLYATLDLSDLPDEAPWQLALSAVIEDKDGGLSYWALAHPPGKPDFHHADGFTLTLTGPES